MNRRWWILPLCLVVIVAIAVLAASLHDVKFDSGRSLRWNGVTAMEMPLRASIRAADVPVWKIVVFWLVMVAVLGLLFLVLSPEARRRILRQMISFAAGVLLLLLALKFQILRLPELSLAPAAQLGQSPSELAADFPVPAFQPPQITVWVVFAVGLVVLWLVFLLGWLSYRSLRRSLAMRDSTATTIAEIARLSLDQLAAGYQWGDVIIGAYARMNEVVSSRRGLRRPVAATPREFAERLVGAGLPEGAVHGLTRLFESVRYGAQASSEADRKQAVACLESILVACGNSA